jgi:hypothetical protein
MRIREPARQRGFGQGVMGSSVDRIGDQANPVVCFAGLITLDLLV